VCYRYNLRASKKDIRDAFAVAEGIFAELADQSTWPMRPGLVVRPRTDGGPGREADALRWGLVPFWAADPKCGRDMANARSETVASKPAFRAAFKARRCLIPATGFCERHAGAWYEFALSDRPIFALAGLWERWDKGEAPLETYTMLTTASNDLVTQYHAKQRMPVVLEPEDYDVWLTGTPEQALALLQTYPADRMRVRSAD
jgi:putative SOS response-associated peptidase YedK